jgi:indolepyruvate decarboxylase
MGFSIPAALGTQIARPDLRSVVIVGDGAFQMTGAELSSLIRHKFPTIIIVLDNGGYGTERFLHPGTFEFNEIQPWAYHKLPEVYGGGKGYEARTEGEFDEALSCAWADTKNLSLIQVHLDRDDHSVALERLTEKLSKRV